MQEILILGGDSGCLLQAEPPGAGARLSGIAYGFVGVEDGVVPGQSFPWWKREQ